MGFTFRVDPIHALAAPMRPLRFRNSRVSTANQIFSSARARWTRSSTSSSVPPASEAAGSRGGVDHADAFASLALPLELLGGLAGGVVGARDAGGDVDRDHVAVLLQKLLEAGDEVTDRGLGGRGQRIGAAQLLEERGVVGDLGFLHRAVTSEDHIEGNEDYPVLLHGGRRQVRGGVRDDGDGRHRLGTL
jgi:hypothetical protein